MQVSVESISQLERRMTVQVPEEQISTEVKSRLAKLSKTAKLPGFRPGKVPLSLIEKRYGSSVRHEVVGEVISKSLNEAFVSENIQPAGRPTIEDIQEQPEQDLEFKALFEVFPEIQLQDFGQLKVEKPVAELTDKDFDKTIEKLLEQHKSWEEVERAAKEGDMVKISFKGSIDGKEEEKASADDFPLELGSGMFIEGFESGLIGLKPGDEKKLELEFPEDYFTEEFAGKPVTFDVTLSTVSEGKVPELDEELLKKIGMAEGDVDKFKDDLRKHMDTELESALENKLKDEVYQKLTEAHEFEIPKSLIDLEAERLEEGIQKQYKDANRDMPPLEGEAKTALVERAKNNVELGLLTREVIRVREIEADEAKVKAKIEKLAASFAQPEMVSEWYYAQPERLNDLRAQVVEDMLIERVLEDAEVSEKSYSYEELVKT